MHLTGNAPIGWSGRIHIARIGLDGRVREEQVVHNLIVDSGLNALAEALDSTADFGSRAIGWVALGDDNTAAASGDLTLGNEGFRKRVASQTQGGIGVIDTTAFINPDQANGFVIREVGWFTADSGGGADTGTLIARVVLGTEIDKTSDESIQITRTDTFTAA